MESTQVRVEYIYDPESHNWCFRVPSLGIIGGAETRDEAETAVVEAIRFTLEGADEAPTPTARSATSRSRSAGRSKEEERR